MLHSFPKSSVWQASILMGLIWLAACGNLFAQQPAFFRLGEKELDGLEIYDIAQDREGRYVIATHEGLLRYDYHQFQPMPCAGAQSMAAFNLVAAPDGSLYCSNLNRQIFRLTAAGCQVIYTLSPEEAAADMSLSVSPAGELVIAARDIIRLDTNGRVLQRLRSRNMYWGMPFQMQDGSLLHHMSNTDSVCRTGRTGATLQALQFLPGTRPPGNQVLTFFRVEGQTCAVSLKSKALYTLEENTLLLRPLPEVAAFRRSPSLRVYPAGRQTWIAGTQRGVVCLGKSWLQQEPAVDYAHEYISEVYADREGNLLLGTFGNGILVIPYPAKRDALPVQAPGTVTTLYAARGQVYMGSQDGSLLRFAHGKLDTLLQGGRGALSPLIGGPDFPWLFYQEGTLQCMDLRTGVREVIGEWSLKDGVVMNDHTALLATNRGLLRLEKEDGKPWKLEQVPGLGMRIYQVERVGEQVVVSTSAGLKCLHTHGSVTDIRQPAGEIYPVVMTAWRGGLLAVCPDGRALEWRQGQIREMGILPLSRWGQCRKLLGSPEGLIAMTAQAFFTLGPDLRPQQNLSQEWGLPARRVRDFARQGDSLWVSNADGVQLIRLNDRPAHNLLPLRFAGIRVNTVQVAAAEGGRSWPSDHRSFEFALAYPSLRYQSSVRIHYRLLGYEDAWNLRANDGQSVTYNALAPGDYRFQARAAFDGRLGEPIEYAFSIAAPLYARPVFILGMALLVLAIVVLIFLQILRVQRRKAARINELNLSRLTAIQSQMNPHFLFNALNSIQDLVLKSDVENAYSYITTFSQVVRSALHYSSREFIDIEQELRLLRLYLSLEQLRFDQSLQYEIETDGVEDVLLPPFLIQPFIENALAHGLLHKSGERRLRIRFELQDKLICTLEDNGIGRAAAERIAQQQATGHTSFASGAIQRRFAILSEMYHDQFGMEYEDLMEHGQPAGTRVILRIPVRRMD